MSTALRRKAARSALVCALAFAIVSTAAPLAAAPVGKPAPSAAHTSARRVSTQAHVEGELLVRFEPGAGELTKRAAHAALGSRVKRSFRIVPGLQSVALSHGRSVAAAIRSYQAMPGVLYAQPNYIKHTLAVPDDPDFGALWGLHNTGQTAGTPDADIDAPEAWEMTTGSSEVVVAVVDTGVDYEHPDLAANTWTNPGEIPDNDVDDDGNGYIDDVHGWDAVNNDGDPMDDSGHGTHCAGTIGGVGNDGAGIVGVNWDVSIMPIKVYDATGFATTDDIVEGFEYLAQSAAHLSSNSWGGWYEVDPAERDAIAAVPKLFVFAAGNESANIDLPAGTTQQYAFPAAYDLPNILSVGASDASDAPAAFSNWGAANVDVFAPGVGILSTQPLMRRISIAPGATVNTILAEDFTSLAGWSTADFSLKPWERVTTRYTSAPASAGHIGYQDNEVAYLDQMATVDLTGADYPGMRFVWDYNLEEHFDFAEIWALDESVGEWYFLGAASGDSGGFIERVIDLGHFAGQNDVRVSFGIYADDLYDSDDGYEGVLVDDVEIFDLDAAVPGASPWIAEPVGNYADAYATWDGTSMAAPHVAGIAGLILSVDESQTFSELKDTIMSTVDVKPVLAGLCVTGGRVNAASAVTTAMPPNAAPLALDDAYNAVEDQVLGVPAGTGVLANDSDPDNNPLTAVLVDDVDHGTLVLNPAGSFSYTPDADYNGPDGFTYKASDGATESASATVTIDVAAVNDPPSGLADNYVVQEDGVLSVPVGTGVLANDSDPENDPLTAQLTADVSRGTLEFNADGSFDYVPDPDVWGLDGFTYTVSDGTHESDPIAVTITVTPAEDPDPLAPVIALSGATRFDTAVAISQEAYPLGLPAGNRTVIIATGRNWPDALGGSALAGVLDGPVLLVDTASVPAPVAAEIGRLGAERAIILGGTSAVGESVESALAQVLAGDAIVERIAGTSRYETADLIAARVIAEQDAWDGTAFVATGAKFPDALGAAPLAAANGWPLYLSHPVTGLSAASRIAMLPVERVLVLGGTTAISAEEYATLVDDFAGNVERLEGADRYETAVTVASFGVQNASLGWNRVAIATGVNFPDALAGGVLQGKMGSVMLLTRPESLNVYTAGALAANRADITTVTYFGGAGALPVALRDEVAEILLAD